MPTVYIVSYEPAGPGESSPRRAYPEAFRKRAWPYGNRDDPSFFCHHEYCTPLTWGATRWDARNRIERGDVALFFSFSQLESGSVEYQFCAAARVEKTIRRTDIFRKPQYKTYRHHFNLLNNPVGKGRWAHREPWRFSKDWNENQVSLLVPSKCAKESVGKEADANESLTLSGRATGRFRHCGRNYVIFSSNPIETQVMSHPPVVAFSMMGAPEHWVVSKPAERLSRVTLGTAQEYGASRITLRTRSQGDPHPSLRWSMPPDRLNRWFEHLLHVMSLSDSPSAARPREELGHKSLVVESR